MTMDASATIFALQTRQAELITAEKRAGFINMVYSCRQGMYFTVTVVVIGIFTLLNDSM